MDLGWEYASSRSWMESADSHLWDISQHLAGIKNLYVFMGRVVCVHAVGKPVFPEAIPTLGKGGLEYNCKVAALNLIQSTYRNWECLLSPPTTEATVSLMHLLVATACVNQSPLWGCCCCCLEKCDKFWPHGVLTGFCYRLHCSYANLRIGCPQWYQLLNASPL